MLPPPPPGPVGGLIPGLDIGISEPAIEEFPTASLVHAAVTTIAAAASAVSAIATGSPDDSDDSNGECRLLGPFALLVQAALGGLALLSLVYKRWRERPQRPVKIWFFDVSKQVFGSVLTHIANVFMSMLTSGRFSIKLDATAVTTREEDYVPNPCSFYLLNLGIDTTLGIPILIVLLRITTGLVAYTTCGQPPESIQSGNYGSPPSIMWWLKQSLIYFVGLFGMKICVLIIFLMMPGIARVGDWALSWTDGNEKLQIAFSMMIFPLIMNCIQYYIIDSFIKKRETGSDHERLPSEDPDENETEWNAERSRRNNHDDGDDDRDETTDVAEVHKGKHNGDEYDPETDGDAPTVAGSGSSRQTGGKGVITTDLFPKE